MINFWDKYIQEEKWISQNVDGYIMKVSGLWTL